MTLTERLRSIGPGGDVTMLAREAADEIDRLEKERFKFETALMLIGQNYPGAAELAQAAIAKPK